MWTRGDTAVLLESLLRTLLTPPFLMSHRATRGVMGTKEFNKFRGQMISLHSQVIKDFGKQIGADIKQVQGLIRLAKKNGEKLGFLA